MKLAELPKQVIDDLSQKDKWRLDIDPGFDAKHEFWMNWGHFITLPEESFAYYEKTEDDLAEFINFHGLDILLPVSRSHHPDIELIRLIPSADGNTVTLYLHDSFYKDWFTTEQDARYGFLAVADRYKKFGCNFYLASYYHFCYLINEDYEVAKQIMRRKLANQ
ncbi:hypothetical protein [Calothrix sp. NIES-3974]|uniref:hypothetical protein n=1 Tax=Calothrix sp. NIES-3974 TaxID=2005462 RepID=UPI000B5F3F82|nr:hypothetical protein [Calothrix sp. NIES-3974]BAZ07174.1 hypothetical protein NIES3974_38370 [Calothrix sp. NIES-3974]